MRPFRTDIQPTGRKAANNSTMFTFKKQKRQMKKYYVARVYPGTSFTPDIIFGTDSREDADEYAAIMIRTEGNAREFIILTPA